MAVASTSRRFWFVAAATLVAGVVARTVILNSTGTPWGSPAGLLGLPPDWRVWLAISTAVALVWPFVPFQPPEVSSLRARDVRTAAALSRETLHSGVVRYLRVLGSVIAGAIAGMMVWVFPVVCLFESGVIRVAGVGTLYGWALIIGAGLGAVCGVLAVPWMGASVGALALARIFLSRAGPSEVPWVLVVLAAGATFGYSSSLLAAALRRRIALLRG